MRLIESDVTSAADDVDYIDCAPDGQ